MKFTIKKVPISKEEKRERAEFFIEDTGQSVDVEAFVNSDIYDEFIDFKCLKCNHEEELEADIGFELFFSEFDSLYSSSVIFLCFFISDKIRFLRLMARS